ncbi:MAG: TlyA family RNA methyltransferase [Desulfotalea sp.]
MIKIRLDQLILDRQLAPDLTKARAIIGAGQVLVDDQPADKVGVSFPENCSIRLRKKCPYVSRGGFKLEQAINFYNIKAQGLICADIGASSGGFTDCLLKHDAKKVYAVDVAYGQLDWKIRQDPRVVVMERYNARKLEHDSLGEPIDLAVMDTSFISITKIIPHLIDLFQSNKVDIVALIKPQFELPKNLVPSGVVSDSESHQLAIDKIISFANSINLKSLPSTASPILGPKGNREFLIRLTSP